MSNQSSSRQEINGHRAKWWQIMFFSMNNAASNLYLFGFMFLSYYISGFLGLATVTIGYVLGFTRLFDGLIDPSIGVAMDNTNTKIGKYRPYMIGGNIILIISFLMLFNTHQIENDTLRLIALIICLIIHKIGYSFQATVTKAAQPVLTTDPKQRPLFSIFDVVFTNVIVFTLGQMYVSQVLIPNSGGDFTLLFYQRFVTLIIIISAIFTVFAVIGIWEKDNEKYFGLGEAGVETKSLKEYWSVLKGNKPFVLLITSSALAKFASSTIGDATVTVMLYGIVLGNYGLSGTVSGYLLVPQLATIIILSYIAGRKGQRFTYLVSVRISLIAIVLLGILLYTSNPQAIYGSGKWPIFVILMLIMRIFVSYPATVSLTMTADVSEYETARSGRYVSGMMGTMFSLTDSLSTSLVPIIVNWIVAAIGFRDSLPTIETAYSDNIFTGIMILFIAIPAVIILIVNILMAKYPLDGKVMADTQKIIELKKEGTIPDSVDGFKYAKENNINLGN